jgi:Uma2 family endonuclease
MATTTSNILLITAEELSSLPDDGYRYELVRGELRKMPPAGGDHGSTAMNIAGPLHQYIRSHKLGQVFAAETGFVLGRNPDTVRAPDVAFVRRERIEAVGKVSGYWPGAPDLAVEVISPGDLYTEVAEKVADWLAAGTALVWVVDPRRRTVTIHAGTTQMRTLSIEDTLDGEPVVPGWRLDVVDIFV